MWWRMKWFLSLSFSPYIFFTRAGALLKKWNYYYAVWNHFPNIQSNLSEFNQHWLLNVATKVESSLLQIDPALCWNFSQTILNFFFWHPLFWLVLFHVVCHCLLFCFENVWEKFHLWAGSIWSKPDSTLIT